tara:strand:+ start:520 stop:1533 length:1014 start_codon:yes stop_codon:yes gene_type:complete
MPKLASVYLIRGDDPTLIANSLRSLTDDLLEGETREIGLEEITESDHLTDAGEYSLEALLSAAQTIPFLTRLRVVVGRDMGAFSKKEMVEPLLKYLGDPLTSTKLVLVWEKGPSIQRLGQIPKALLEVIQESGELLDTRVGRKNNDWIREQVLLSGLQLDKAAVQALQENTGEDVASVPGVLDTLRSAFGEETLIKHEDISPYLGSAGDIPPWELTDAISNGNAALAIQKLERLRKAGGRHEMQILAVLHSHFSRILRLAGLNVGSAKEAAELLGDKGSSFRAGKSLQDARKLGSPQSRKAISLLADADLAIRGQSSLSGGAILEVLVARLSYLYKV